MFKTVAIAATAIVATQAVNLEIEAQEEGFDIGNWDMSAIKSLGLWAMKNQGAALKKAKDLAAGAGVDKSVIDHVVKKAAKLA